VEFPSYYTFGGDTAEATTNVHVTFTPQGYAELSVGKPDLTYVVINSPSTLHIEIETTTSGAVQTTTTQRSNTTQTSVTTTTTATTTTQSATSSTTTTSAQTSITSTTTQTTTPQTSVPSQTSSGQSITYVVPIGGLIAAGVLLVYYALRRRK